MPGRLDEPDRMVNRAAYLTLRPIPSLLQAYSRFYNRREQWSNVQQEHSNSTLWFLMSSYRMFAKVLEVVISVLCANALTEP